MGVHVSSPEFIGRRPELERLSGALAAAADGRPGLLLVAGDAGVGKTRLVMESVRRARASGVAALVGGCIPVGDAGVPFAPVLEALRDLVRSVGRRDFEALAGAGRAELARLVPGLAAAGPDDRLLGRWEQARLFELLLGLLDRLAERSPVIFVVEDLHWADQATRGLLAYLVHNLAGERLLLVGTLRPDDLHHRHPLLPLLAELERSPRVERMDLGPFDRDELAELLRAILGRDPDPMLVARIAERSEGNAYLAEELAALGPAAGLPPTVEQVLLARVDRLDQGARDVLRIASASGPRVDTELLAAVASEILPDPEPSIRELVDDHILVRREGDGAGERYAFRHALLAEAVYRQLLPAERLRYHEAFARVLSVRPDTGDPASLAELAHHWEAAGDLPSALLTAVEAGRAAAGIYAFGDAQRLFEQAAKLWGSVPDAARRAGLDLAALLELAAMSADAAGDSAAGVRDIRRAIACLDEAADPVRAGLLHERLGRYAYDAADYEVAVSESRRAVALVPANPPTLERARVLAGLARSLTFTGSLDDGAATADQAIAMARLLGAKDVEADALASLGSALADNGSVGPAVPALRRALDLALEIGDDYVALRAWTNLIGTMCYLPSLATLEGCVSEAVHALAWGDEHGRARTTDRIALLGAYGLLALGRWTEAEALARRVPRSGRAEDAIAGSMLVWVAIGRGELDAAGRLLAPLGDYRPPGIPLIDCLIADAAAALAMARGDLHEAGRLVRPGLRLLAGLDRGDANLSGRILWTALRIQAELAESARARAATTDLAEATSRGRAIIEQARAATASVLAEAPEMSGRPSAVLATCEAEWSRLRGTHGVAPWRRAAAACAAAGQLDALPYIRYRQAEAMLASRADRAEAAAVLLEAHESAIAMGARPLQTEIERLARRARLALGATTLAGPRGLDPSAPLGLTPREREVLALVAAGRTNRQIAAALFISQKTASVHVSNILGKLDASGRTEAAAIAHRLGLVG